MSVIDFIGWAAAIFAMVFSLPQLVRIMRTKDTNGLSLLTWQLQTAVVAAWFLHGFIYNQPQQIFANLVALTMNISILVLVIQQRKLNWLRSALPVLLVAAVLIAIDIIFGRVVYGIVIIFPQCYALVTQLRALFVDEDISGVSPLFFVMGLFTQVLFLIWAIGIHDPAVALAGGCSAVLLVANLIVWGMRKRGMKARVPVNAH